MASVAHLDGMGPGKHKGPPSNRRVDRQCIHTMDPATPTRRSNEPKAPGPVGINVGHKLGGVPGANMLLDLRVICD